MRRCGGSRRFRPTSRASTAPRWRKRRAAIAPNSKARMRTNVSMKVNIQGSLSAAPKKVQCLRLTRGDPRYNSGDPFKAPHEFTREDSDMQEIDQRDRELLGALQGEIPLVSTPYAVIGQMIEMSEKEVIKRTERLKREGSVRHLGAHFDARALGYRSCLVAAKVSPDRIDEAALV